MCGVCGVRLASVVNTGIKYAKNNVLNAFPSPTNKPQYMGAGARPEMIANAAGVKSIDWLLTYNRADIGDRLQASWALGL